MMTNDALASVLRRFIEYNRDDHGYVSLDDHGLLILDGNITLTEEERDAVAEVLKPRGL